MIPAPSKCEVEGGEGNAFAPDMALLHQHAIGKVGNARKPWGMDHPAALLIFLIFILTICLSLRIISVSRSATSTPYEV